MSRRNRRQQEELQDLQAGLLPTSDDADHADQGVEDLEEEDEEYIPRASTSKFAALTSGGLDDDGDESEDDDAQPDGNGKKSKKKRNKKKKPKTAVANNVEHTTEATPAISATDALKENTSGQSTPPAKSKSSKKKGKQKSNSTALDEETDGLDEIDRALQQLGVTGGKDTLDREVNTAGQTGLSAPAASRMRALLSVEMNNLDADAELKRFFGAKVVASADVKPQVRGARAKNPHHALHRQYARGGILAKPKPSWPPAAFSKSGLSMELVDTAAGETLWTFDHSKGYKEVTHMYLEAVSSMDPNQMMAMLHVHPYHVETLLGLSDMAAQQGDPGMSQDFLDRALYAFEKAFAPAFSIQNGNVRLDFSRIESRGFYRALEKRINSMSRRGTWRTLFEHCKLLYSLSPYNDPYGALLFLDFTAPKSKQYTWLIEFMEELPSMLERNASHAGSHLQIDAYPGLHFATALSKWHREVETKISHDGSTASLRQAILRYPLVAFLLLQKLQLPIPKELSVLPQAQPETGYTTRPSYILQLLGHLYVHRSDTLWREPEVMEWLQGTIRATTPEFAKSEEPDVSFGSRLWHQSPYPKNGVPEGILRHVLVSDIQPLRTFLPQSALNSMSFAFDPLPPGPGFDDNYFKSMYEGDRRTSRVPTGGNRSGQRGDQADTAGFIQRLMQYLQTGGTDGGELDADTQAAVIAQLEQLTGNHGDGDLPGNFPGASGADSDTDNDNEDGPQRPRRGTDGGFMNLFRGLWPANGQPALHEADSEDEESEVDDSTNLDR